MTNQDMYLTLVDQIVTQMHRDKAAFATMTRSEITTRLREISGQPRSKIGQSVGDAIEAAFDQRGFRAFPSINDLKAGDATRIIRRGSFADQILNYWLHPGTITDSELAKLISKVKQHDESKKSQGGSSGSTS